MSKKTSLSSYNETHLLISLGLLAMLAILPMFYNIGPSSVACSVSLASNINTAVSSAAVKAPTKKLPNLFIPSAIPVLANKKLKISKVIKEEKKVEKKVVVEKVEEKAEEQKLAPKEEKKEEPVKKAEKPKLAKVYFGFNSSTLPVKVKKDMQEIVSYLKENDSSKVGLKGYHDNAGADYVIYNKRIALKRAHQVYNFLIAQGIPAERVILKKPGESLGTGSNWEARRVEAFILE